MYQATHSLIREMYKVIRAHHPNVGEVSRQVHEQLYEAVAAKDADRAAALMDEHLRDFNERADRLQVQLRGTWDDILAPTLAPGEFVARSV
jgi:DNA-binding GntR family transcriptional regulator